MKYCGIEGNFFPVIKQYGKAIHTHFNGVLQDSNTTVQLLAFTRDLFKTLSLLYENCPDKQKCSKFCKDASNIFSDVKCVMDFLRFPERIATTYKSWVKTAIYTHKFYFELRGRCFNKLIFFKTIKHGSKSTAKTVSLIGKTIIKPILFMHRHSHLGSSVDRLMMGWSVVALVGKGFKIIYFSCEIIEGKDLVIRVVQVALEVSDFVVKSVQLAQIKVHPVIPLSIGLCKNIVLICLFIGKNAKMAL